jgi:hypothetical protein
MISPDDRPAESASQLLHRLTSYAPERDWTEPIDDPRLVQDLEVNDLAQLPWWHKHYPESLPSRPLPRELPSVPTSATAVPGRCLFRRTAGAGRAGAGPAAVPVRRGGAQHRAA